jgi:membrane-bound lytic murein transglycosylase B
MATLITLEGKKGTEYWLGLKNFYVITRYNHSALYAMAVYDLSQELNSQS